MRVGGNEKCVIKQYCVIDGYILSYINLNLVFLFFIYDTIIKCYKELIKNLIIY